MRAFIAIAKNKQLVFSSGLYEAMFRNELEANEDREYRITRAKSSMSDKMRGFYWSVVVETAKATVPEWKTLASHQVHECLKKMFSYFEARNPLTGRTERFGDSIMADDSTTEDGMKFIEKVEQFLITKYKTRFPSPEKYKEYRDSAPLLTDENTIKG